jgi:hypothetical protein
MTRDEQDEAFNTYAANLQASMARHPAGKQRDVGTPIHDALVLEQYETSERSFNIALGLLFAMVAAVCILALIA